MDIPNDDDVASASALAVAAIAVEDENNDDDDEDAELLNYAGSSLVALVFANDNIAEKDAPALWCGSGE